MKTRLIRTLTAVAALAVSAVPSLQAPASAADAAVVVGIGSITPGIPVEPTACVNGATFTIPLTAANLGTRFGPGPYSFTVTGTSQTCASILSDEGSATFVGEVTGTVHYTRTTGFITLSGSVRVNNSAPVDVTVVCGVVITSAAPTSTFAVVCPALMP
ncbi:MAG TPA: hypothetical protein VNQ77_01960 [Frankiaceae bacterium]|nr:hypothetical protein [Frankiaceae bacterium]